MSSYKRRHTRKAVLVACSVEQFVVVIDKIEYPFRPEGITECKLMSRIVFLWIEPREERQDFWISRDKHSSLMPAGFPGVIPAQVFCDRGRPLSGRQWASPTRARVASLA